MNTIKIKGVLSSILFILFIILLVTSIGLFLSPSDEIAVDSGWNFLGLAKQKLIMLHTIFGFLMLLLMAIHFILNFKILKAELFSLIKN